MKDRRIAAVATGQLGTFSREQAHVAGLSDDQLRRRVQSGILESVGPHAFRATSAPRTELAALAGLVLDVGEPCWVSGPTAAALHGFDGMRLRPPFHLLLRRDRNVRRIGVVVHTTIDLPHRPSARCWVRGHERGTHRDRASPNGAAGRACSMHRLGAAGRTAQREPAAPPAVRPPDPWPLGLPKLLDVLAGHEASRGGHSWLERRFLQLLADAGMPRPHTQRVLTKAGDRLVRVDCHFPGTTVVVELLGYRFHRSRSQMSRDVSRMNALLGNGLVPYQFTYAQVVDEPQYVVTTLACALTSSA